MSAAEKLESTELTLPQRAAVALKSSETEKELYKLVQFAMGITAVTNKAGRDECHSALMTLTKARTSIQKIAKAARDDANKFSKAIIAEENRLISTIASEEDRLQALRDKWDADREAERQAALRKEQARIDAIRERIEDMRKQGTVPFGATAADIKFTLDRIKAVDIDESFAEFRDEAMQVKGQVKGELVLAHNSAVTAERQAAEKVEAERIERERFAAEQEKLKAERELLERAQAELRRAEQERILQHNAEVERHQAEMKRQREELEQQRRELEAQRREIEEDAKPEPVDAVAEALESVIDEPVDHADAVIAGWIDEVINGDAPPLADIMPPDIELPVSANELERRELDLIRSWLVSFQAAAPVCKTPIAAQIVNGLLFTVRDEIGAIDLLD